MFRGALKLCQFVNARHNQKLFKPQSACCQFLNSYCTNTSLELPTNNQNLPQESQPELKRVEKWTPIYKYEKIKVVSIVGNLKKYQAVGGGISIVCFGVAETMGLADAGGTLTFAAMVAFSQFGLWVYSSFFYNLIGFMYVCPKIEKIRIAYLDFWGKRKEKEIPITDLILPANRKAMVTIPVRFTSATDILQLRVKGGDVLESYVYSYIFGESSDDAEEDQPKEVAPKPLLRRRRPRYGTLCNPK